MSRYIKISIDGFLKDSELRFTQVIQNKRHDYREFIIRFRKELDKTKEAKTILVKYANGEAVSVEEQVFFKKQVIEVSKSIGLGIPILIVPGGILLLSFILWLSKKYNIDILPSYLNKKKED